jgi:hypothetical protein
VFDNTRTGCRRVRQFISIKRTFVSLAKAVTLVLVLFILMQLAETNLPDVQYQSAEKAIVKGIYGTYDFNVIRK